MVLFERREIIKDFSHAFKHHIEKLPIWLPDIQSSVLEQRLLLTLIYAGCIHCLTPASTVGIDQALWRTHHWKTWHSCSERVRGVTEGWCSHLNNEWGGLFIDLQDPFWSLVSIDILSFGLWEENENMYLNLWIYDNAVLTYSS